SASVEEGCTLGAIEEAAHWMVGGLVASGRQCGRRLDTAPSTTVTQVGNGGRTSRVWTPLAEV
ncbi:hypothetical protein, partial [Dermacoccus sp. UBA1591]|uniref:hypothetical protein n=1 Tax=Dermacoccus sp. UBA1591 TaxID=1946405 RepID=UPI00257A1725